MTKWSQSKYTASGQNSWPICYSWIFFFFKLELGNKVNSFWMVEIEMVKFRRYKATLKREKFMQEKKNNPLSNSFSIKPHNTNLSYCIYLKYIKPLPGREKMYDSVNVTNLVCSWVQHKWLAFLFCVQMAACQRTRSGDYFKPGQHLFSHLGKTKQIKIMRNLL